MPTTLTDLDKLYHDTKTCAKLVGLSYVESDRNGFTRQKRGKGFSYIDNDRKPLPKQHAERITQLIIPPAWQEVWICPSAQGHILATGVDEEGRKQYIYHPKWRTMRDLIKFYRLISFAQALPRIRRTINKNLTLEDFSYEKVIAIMLWILDNAYIRVGNDIYYQQRESIGLTTLTDKNLVLAGPVVTLSFTGKSGKPQQITFEDKVIATALDELRKARGERLFRYRQGSSWQPIDAASLNSYLQEISGARISAKDFRT